jgi:AcrR family transcriptional regulator
MASNQALETIRKSQIMAAALSALSELGIQGVTLDHVAKAAGLSKGGVTHYFSSKDSLFKEAFKYFFEGIFQRGRENMARYEDPLDQLLSFDWLFDWDDPQIHLGFRLMSDCMALATHDEEIRLIFYDWIENWVVLLSGAIEQGVADGRFNLEDDVPNTARAISAVYQGLVTRWYLARETHSTEWALRSLKKTVLSLLEI